VEAPSSGSIPPVAVVTVVVEPEGFEDLLDPPHPEETASRARVTRPVETSLRMSAAYWGSVRKDGGMLEIAPGLRRWTTRHEEWEEEVGSLAVETSDGLVLIDPIDPPREVARPDHVLVTIYYHGRSTGELGAKRVWAPARSSRPLESRGIEVTDAFRAGDELPGGIRAIQTARAAEVVYWLPAQRALVVGDVLLGAGAKPRATSDPLRLCPERWLGKGTHDELRRTLRPLLDLPVESVLVSHGVPILSGGKDALAVALN
jgi:glyoxylase-like metal-dependent hydrolase (beta-lactamase superfamily II)